MPGKISIQKDLFATFTKHARQKFYDHLQKMLKYLRKVNTCAHSNS